MYNMVSVWDSFHARTRSLALLAAILLPIACSADNPLGPEPFFSTYPIGELFTGEDVGWCMKIGESAASMNGNAPQTPKDVDLAKPCPALKAFFANCSLGISLQQESSDADMWYHSDKYQGVPFDQQQQCYCAGDYWAYNFGCNACLQLHGYDHGEKGWLATEYVSQQSSAYCTGTPNLGFADFLSAFTPTSTLTSMISLSTQYTGDPAMNQTAVSDYFTTPSAAPTFPTGTNAPTPSLDPGLPQSTMSTKNAAPRMTAVPLGMVGMGVAALMIN